MFCGEKDSKCFLTYVTFVELTEDYLTVGRQLAGTKRTWLGRRVVSLRLCGRELITTDYGEEKKSKRVPR